MKSAVYVTVTWHVMLNWPIGCSFCRIWSDENMTQSQLLSAACEALFGGLHLNKLAVMLGINDRTARRWMAGTETVPFGVWLDIAQEAGKRRAMLTILIEDIGNIAEKQMTDKL